jgi:hypothetical protein
MIPHNEKGARMRSAMQIGTAGRLHDRLAMDVDHIPAGVDFVEYLHSQVAACDVFLAVIGQRTIVAVAGSTTRTIT